MSSFVFIQLRISSQTYCVRQWLVGQCQKVKSDAAVCIQKSSRVITIRVKVPMRKSSRIRVNIVTQTPCSVSLFRLGSQACVCMVMRKDHELSMLPQSIIRTTMTLSAGDALSDDMPGITAGASAARAWRLSCLL